jgi:hypothetical protein
MYAAEADWRPRKALREGAFIVTTTSVVGC